MNLRNPSSNYGDELQRLIDVLPKAIQSWVLSLPNLDGIMEIVMDLGRPVEVRFSTHSEWADDLYVTEDQINYVCSLVGEFDRDNRAGIDRTLHRVSCILARDRTIIGLTLRVGRPVEGSADVIADLLKSGKSVLLLGRPGVGKTTLLRDAAHFLSTDHAKRVVIVDTNNEIGGYGNIPHPIIGRARRMQVPRGTEQHEVMIEAVENHTPQVIVVDEIGNKSESFAARAISERGVQLIATAHGNSLENLVRNPEISDLVGGVQSVTLGDDEAARRGSQKTVLEQKAPSTFDVIVEIRERHILAVHTQADKVVATLLRGITPHPQVRVQQPDGSSVVVQEEKDPDPKAVEVLREGSAPAALPQKRGKVYRVMFRGIPEDIIQRVLRSSSHNLEYTTVPSEAHFMVSFEMTKAARQRRTLAVGANLRTFPVTSSSYEAVAEAVRTGVRNEQRRPSGAKRHKGGKMRR